MAYQAATAGAGHAEALSRIIASGQWNVSFVTESRRSSKSSLRLADPRRFHGGMFGTIVPRTGRRATKLFLPNGGQHFWSRAGYGLGYASQREGRFDRLQRRAARC